MEGTINDNFQRRVLKVSEPDMTLKGQSKIRRFVSGCTCSPEAKQNKEAYDALASKLEELRKEFKVLLSNGSSSTQELARLKTEIGKLSKSQDDIKPKIGGCPCWAETAYEIWDEPGVMFQEGLFHPYREYKKTKFYLNENGYFTYDPVKEIPIYFPLGYGVYYRDPYYKPLHLCAWHGSLTVFQKNEIAERMYHEGESIVMGYANPIQYLDITGVSERYVGEKKTRVMPSGEQREFLVINSEGPIATYAVYVYIRYGDKIDVACYDNCYAQSMDAVMSEINFNDDKVRRLRSFIKEVRPIHEAVVKGYSDFESVMKRMTDNNAQLRKVNAALSNLNANNRGREVDTAKEAVARAKENLENAREGAKASWLKRVLKAKNTKTMIEEAKTALKGAKIKTFDELMTMEQPPEDAPELTIRLYNATIYYENYDIDVEEGKQVENVDKREALKAEVIDLHIKTLLKQKSIFTYDFDKILQFTPSEEDLNENSLLSLINLYNLQIENKEDKEAESTKEQIISLYGDIKQEKDRRRAFDEVMSREFNEQEDSDLEKELFTLIQTYKTQIENKEEKLAEKTQDSILALYDEIKEEEEEDRLFEENLSKSLLDVPVEMDTSQAAQDRYIDVMCSAMKTAYTNAASALKIKEGLLRKDEAQRPTLEKKQEILTNNIAQDNNDMYETITKAHFYGKWFLQQAQEFVDLQSGERFTLEEEEETKEVLSPQKLRFKQERQVKEFDSTREKILNRYNNVASLVDKTQALLTKYKHLWPEQKVNNDYENYVRVQKEYSMPRAEREELKAAAAKASLAKGITTRKVGVMQRPKEDEEEEETKTEKVIIRPMGTSSSGPKFVRSETKVVLTWDQRYKQAQLLEKVVGVKAPMTGPVQVKTTSPVPGPAAPSTNKLAPLASSLPTLPEQVLPPFASAVTVAITASSSSTTVIEEPSEPKNVYTPSRVKPSTPTIPASVPIMPFEATEGSVSKAFTPSKIKVAKSVVTRHTPIPVPSPRAKSPVSTSREPLKATSSIKGMTESSTTDFPTLPKAPVRPVQSQSSVTPISSSLSSLIQGYKPAPPKKEVTPKPAETPEASSKRLTLKKITPLIKPPVETKTTQIIIPAPPPIVQPTTPETVVAPPKPKAKSIPPKPKSSIKPRPSNVFSTLDKEEVEEENAD